MREEASDIFACGWDGSDASLLQGQIASTISHERQANYAGIWNIRIT